jgi:hypothetical protein
MPRRAGRTARPTGSAGPAGHGVADPGWDGLGVPDVQWQARPADAGAELPAAQEGREPPGPDSRSTAFPMMACSSLLRRRDHRGGGRSRGPHPAWPRSVSRTGRPGHPGRWRGRPSHVAVHVEVAGRPTVDQGDGRGHKENLAPNQQYKANDWGADPMLTGLSTTNEKSPA